MINFTFNTADLTLREASALHQFLGVFIEMGADDPFKKAAVKTPGVKAFEEAIAKANKDAVVEGKPPVGASSEPDPALTEAAVEKTPRKPREKKEEPASKPVKEPEPQTEPTPGCIGLEPPTMDALRAGLQTFVEKHGFEAAEPFLASFGCKRVSEVTSLPEAKQHEFMKACNV